MKLRANCKINLGLRVVRRRADGFHDIETVMWPVQGLFDELSVTPYPVESLLEVSGTETGCPAEKNICMRALRLVQREYDIGGTRIKLHKRIPTGAGLGGGSTDAAFTLRALNGEFSLDLPDARLEELATELGSDVPFFIRNTPQLCTGRGEIMTSVEVPLAGKWLVILKPGTAVSTAEAYAGITPREEGLSVAEIVKHPVDEWRKLLVNDFEESVFARHPEIGLLKELLYGKGALYASMSGSGSAVFGIFDRKPTLDTDTIFIHSEQI